MSATPTTKGAEARERLREIGRVRAGIMDDLAEAEEELAEAIVAANAAGVPKRAIALEAGCVRQHVYNVLARR